MNSAFQLAAPAVAAISTLSLLSTSATAGMVWTANQLPDGQLVFAVGDTDGTVAAEFAMDLASMDVDRGVRASLFADPRTGMQHMGLTWVDANGDPQSTSLQQYGVVPADWSTNRAKFSYRAQEVLAGRGNAMNDDVVGQFDINPLDDVAARTELFAVVATDQSQADASA